MGDAVMRRFLVIGVGVLLAVIAATMSTRASVIQDGEPQSNEPKVAALETLAGQVLLTELQSKYPETKHWSVTPLVRQAHEESIFGKAAWETKVVRIGARSAVQVSWAAENTARQVRTVWFDVVGPQSVVVATHAIAPNASLSVADAMIEERDVMGLSCSPLRDVTDLVQMRSRRALRTGAAICLEAIEPRPAVARGEDVTVRYSSGRVSITTKGVAQNDGQVGQKLRVVNPMTKDSFVAVVSAAREVLVHE
jgi:flagella basal body P-ring formation protein FlgA